jgi:FAD/FMN-containing dehydrogenase
MSTLTSDTVATLAELGMTLDGALLLPGDATYEDARRVWNGMIDARPAAIARCASTRDVQAAVRAARATGLPLAVRGGGHNVAGLATVDGGLVVDLSAFREVVVDPEARIATVGGGATLKDVDAATQRHGLAVPAGVVSDTGIAGLTLSGGLGWLRRKHGLTCDNVVAAELVTADADVLNVDAESDPELLFGLRGGGGNFGVVTSFTFQLHAVGPDVAFTFVLYPLADARQVLAGHEEVVLAAGDEISTIVFTGHVPPVEPFPAEIHEAPFVAVAGMYAGPAGDGEQALAPLRSLATPLADLSSVLPYVEAQQILDADYPAGHRYYWKATYAEALTDEVVDLLVEHTHRAPSGHSTIDVWLNGGAMGRVAGDAAAFAGRDRLYAITAEANWEHPDDDEANVAWGRGVLAALEAHVGGGLYLNFPGFLEEGRDLVQESFGANYPRLAALKRRLDPKNVFRRNANIEPAAGEPGV